MRLGRFTKGTAGHRPVGEDAGAQAADGVTEDGTAGEVSALQARHHGPWVDR